MKKIMAAIMTMILFTVGLYTPQTVYGAAVHETTQSIPSAEMNNDTSVEGTNSFGKLFADMAEAKLKEQEENQGYNVFSVNVFDNQAVITFETLEDCTLVVAIYDEAGKKMLTSSSVEVEKGEISAVADLKQEEMPEYFYLRCFMVEQETMRPLCTAYESPNYTKEMQEFFAKTIKDFDDERVLNLDDDAGDNFAVFNDETKRIPYKEGVNEVVSADEEKGIYVFDNADENMDSLKKGDIFALQSAEGEELIVKIGSVKKDGSKVNITAEDTSMEEVFQYVKVNGKSDVSKAKIDHTNPQQGMECKGVVEDKMELKDTNGYAIEYTFVDKTLKSVTNDNEDEVLNVKLNGSIKLAIDSTVKLYINFSYLYFEMSLDYSLKGNLSVSGKASVDIPLATLGFSPVAGVYLEFTPSFVMEVSGEVEFSLSIEGSVGFSISSKEGIKNLTSFPYVKPEIQGSIKIFVGISLKPKLKIISSKVADVEFDAAVGGEVSATLSKQQEISFGTSDELPEKIHNCKNCVDGDIIGKWELNLNTKLLNSEKLTFSYEKKNEKDIGDFYWSIGRGEFGFGSCPYIYWKRDFKVKDESKNPVEGMKVSVASNGKEKFVIKQDTNDIGYAEELITDSKGEAVGYLSNGEYKIAVENANYSGSKYITVADKAKRVVITVERKGPKLAIYDGTSTVITEDGSLYMWGENYYGQVGDGTKKDRNTPIKILENVASVSIEDQTVRALTIDGELYMWGNNKHGQIGDGTTENRNTPIKVLENVASVSMDNIDTVRALTIDGKLYMWGNNCYGQIGDGTTEDKNIPYQVLENETVVSVSMNAVFNTGAITKDGKLYMWGDWYKQTENGSIPQQILKDETVVDISMDGATAKAITKDGKLYMWGWNEFGQLGDGTTESRYTDPKQVLEIDNVASIIECSNDETIGAITKDGKLYIWGRNQRGQVGDGTTINRSVPFQVLKNEIVVFATINLDTVSALTKDGKLYLWGANGYGQVGDGTRENRKTPYQVFKNETIVSFETGQNTGALTKDGKFYLWGWNRYGEVGDGTTNDRSVPYQPLKDETVIAFSCLGRALTKDGKLYMWGKDDYGQVGDGTEKGRNVPYQVLKEKIVISASMNNGATVGAMTKDGELYMWGNNQHGQVGNGTFSGNGIYEPTKIELSDTAALEKVSVVTSNEQIANSVSLNSDGGTNNITETTDLQKIVATGENGNAAGLMPETVYNYYIMKSKSQEQPFTTDNLLYIGQGISDAFGNLHIDCEMKEDYGNPETVVVGMKQLELSQDQITVSDVMWNGQKQDIYPEVYYQGTLLTEDKDYEVSGDFSAKEVGEYIITIEGIGYYTGIVCKNYKVYQDETIVTLTPAITEEPEQTPTPSIEPTQTPMQTITPTQTLTPTAVLTPTKKPSATPEPKTENKTIKKTYGADKFSVAINNGNSLKYKSSKTSVAAVNAKGMVTIKGCGKSTITITNAATGHVYQKITLTVVPQKPTLSVEKTSTKKVLKIKWKKDTKADGFEIYYSTNKNFSKKKSLLVNSKTTKKTVKNLKSGKKYYVKIRAYKNWNGTKLKGAWSKTVNVKVK